MEKRLYRSPVKKICGICGGFADYFRLDPTVVRIAVVIATIYTAIVPALVVYFVLALVFPEAPENYYEYYGVNNAKKLYKGREKSISGVCSGIAEYLKMDVTIIRLAFVFFILCLGTGAFAYIACACLMPSRPETLQDNSGANYNDGYNNKPPYNN